MKSFLTSAYLVQKKAFETIKPEFRNHTITGFVPQKNSIKTANSPQVKTYLKS